MTSKTNRLITYIKEINFTLSDFLLMFGFLFSIPFYAFAWKFMVTSDPNQIYFNNRMIITCFSITIICWAIYFVLEIKKGRINNHLFTWVYVLMAILSVVAVLIQKNVNTFYVECKIIGAYSYLYYPEIEVGDVIKVVTTISPTHKLFFACATLVITTIFYIVLVVLPKRIRKMEFLAIIGIITIVFMVGMCIYSYISEAEKYVPFFRAFIGGNGELMKAYSMNSFVVMSVPYGVCMMLAFLFVLLVHTITQKHYWYIFAIFFLVNMLFSYCRTSIAISYIIFALYIVFRLVITFKKHKIRNVVLISLFALFLGGLVAIILTSYKTEGAFLPTMYRYIKSFTDTSSFNTRKFIWGNIRDELKDGWLVTGRGFGTHNFMLYAMNLVNGDNVCPSHSTYYAILGAGGIIAMLGFLGLMAYYVVIFIKSLKFSKTMPIVLSIGLLGFLAYSFTEGVNYLIVFFTFPLILFYHTERNQNLAN